MTLAGGDQDETLRALIARLIDNGKDYARAELTVVKQTALGWTSRAKPAIAFVAIALLLAQAALTVLIAAIGMAIAPWIGPAGGLAVAALLALATAGLLVFLAIRQFSGLKS